MAGLWKQLWARWVAGSCVLALAVVGGVFLTNVVSGPSSGEPLSAKNAAAQLSGAATATANATTSPKAAAAGAAVADSAVAASGAAAGVSSQLLSYLQAISGSWTVAGQHNKEPLSQPTYWTDTARSITGRAPGLYGGDFAFSGPRDRPTMIDAATAQWNSGALVTLTWHMCPPTVADPCDWVKDIQSHLTDAQWAQITTNGTALNRAWQARMDAIVPLLRTLQSRGVAVLWRPDHEMNDGWSWWGGRPGASGSRLLYRMTHDYLTSKGLTNLVWVWSIKDVNTGSFADYYPGDEYVDVIGLDSWMKAFPSHETYRRVLDVAHGKPIALAEVGTIPTPEQLIAQPRWAYFMVWSEHLTDSRYNSPARVKRTYAAARVLTRDRVSRGSAPVANPANAAENLALGQPIWASSIDAAGRKPDKAVDGETRTRWSSAYADSQWIYVDLQRSYAIDGVTISWETAYAKKFQIQVSNDQNTWTTIYQNDAGNGGASTIKLAGQRARYVKIYAWERGTKWGYSVWEFTVQGR